MKLIHTSLVLLGTIPLLSAATLVNIDFNSTGSGGPSGTFTGSGPLGGGTWNAVTHTRAGSAGTSVAASNLLDSSGGVSTVGVAVGVFNNSTDLNFQANVDDSMDPLMSDYLYLYTPQISATITLSGLPALATCDLVLFGANANGQGSVFTIGATSKSTSDTDGIGASLIEGDEYVRFNGVTTDGSGNLTVAWTKTTTFGGLNGMQV